MKTVGIYAALLGAALVGSYLTWTADEGGASGDDKGVAVYRASTGDVKELSWKDTTLDVKVSRREDAAGPYVWVVIDESREVRPPPEPHDHDADHGQDTDALADTDAAGPEAPPAPKAPPEIVTTHTEFAGSEAATGLFTTFEPLMALRELQTAGLDASTFGFEAPAEGTKGGGPATLVVTRSGGSTSITVGGETYGAKDRYAKADGKVYLLEDTTVRPLQYALTRLQETRVHPFAEPDLERVSVRRGAASVVLVQQNKADRAAAFWSRAQDAETRDDVADTWLDKLLRLKVQGYPAQADVPATTPALAVELTDGKATWTVEILKADEGGAWYARSSFNRALVQLAPSFASEAVADADELFQD